MIYPADIIERCRLDSDFLNSFIIASVDKTLEMLQREFVSSPCPKYGAEIGGQIVNVFLSANAGRFCHTRSHEHNFTSPPTPHS